MKENQKVAWCRTHNDMGKTLGDDFIPKVKWRKYLKKEGAACYVKSLVDWDGSNKIKVMI